ncbi:D-alanine--D-alanine ligase [Saccharothrix xinjiangensis]|uniref:D-alanine--D-alanine ligase n=1 Tax=Saccharothrix xinjiangensis TaxID=204798 RepID=A0ABV9XXQ6_9PSEU
MPRNTGTTALVPPDDVVVGVLTGGASGERHRSLATGADVAQALTTLGHRIHVIDTADPGFPDQVRAVDVAFLALAGRHAEDGTLQGFLETSGIPYTGSGVRASALAMHKPTAKTVVRAAGVPVLTDVLVTDAEPAHAAAEDVLALLDAPVIVKARDEGSSIGLAVARDEAELTRALEGLHAAGHSLFVEPFVEGRTVTVGVLEDNNAPVPLPAAEILAIGEFYDQTAKNHPGLHSFRCPADLPDQTAFDLAEAARSAHTALGCSSHSRSDFIIAPDGRIHWLELNTLPALRRTATLPLMAAAADVGYEELIERVLRGASTPRG